MQCYKKEDEELKISDCTEREEAECRKFIDKYYIVDSESNNADTEDGKRVYGDGKHERGIRTYTVILENGVAVGCVYGGYKFYLNGERSFSGGSYNPYTGIGVSWEVSLWEEK